MIRQCVILCIFSVRCHFNSLVFVHSDVLTSAYDVSAGGPNKAATVVGSTGRRYEASGAHGRPYYATPDY